MHEDETIVENPAHIRLAMRWSEEGGWSARPAGWTASAVAAAGLPMRCPEDAGGGPSTAAAATHCAQTGPGSPGAAAGGTAPPPGRKVAPAEQRRLAANAAIDASGAAAAAACAAYLTDNLPVLGPFLAANDVARLQRAVAKASGARCSLELLDSLQLLEPAPTIRAELRPYQLEGLRWLATMRHQGVSCILADEMVRCSSRPPRPPACMHACTHARASVTTPFPQLFRWLHRPAGPELIHGFASPCINFVPSSVTTGPRKNSPDNRPLRLSRGPPRRPPSGASPRRVPAVRPRVLDERIRSLVRLGWAACGGPLPVNALPRPLPETL